MEKTKTMAAHTIHGAGKIIHHGAWDYEFLQGHKQYQIKLWGQPGHFTADAKEAKKHNLIRVW